MVPELWNRYISLHGLEAKACPPCSGAGHVEWIKTLKELVMALSAYIRAHHVAGPSWNPAGRPLSQFKGAVTEIQKFRMNPASCAGA